MELRLPAGSQAHSCNDLALFHRVSLRNNQLVVVPVGTCLLYTSDAADE